MPRATISVSKKCHAALETFCEVTNRPIEEVADDLLFEWLSTIGKSEMEGVVNAGRFRRSLAAECEESKTRASKDSGNA